MSQGQHSAPFSQYTLKHGAEITHMVNRGAQHSYHWIIWSIKSFGWLRRMFNKLDFHTTVSTIKSTHLATTCQACWKCHDCISLLNRIMGFLIGITVCN